MKAVITTLAIMLVLNSVQAQDARRTNGRIRQGVRSGELTKAETIKLKRDQREIRQDVREAKADGVVTPAEKREIKQDKRQLNRAIIRKKHNRRDRG
jgi:low affinity Fe/Cu permease